jgi:hypothetical protein
MPNPPQVQVRTSIVSLLLVAILSALVVASIYEIRARLAKRAVPTREESETPEQSAPVPDQRSPMLAQEDCVGLKRRYLARCSDDLQPAPKGELSCPQVTHPEDEARVASALADWQNPGPTELAAMAKRCEVRFEMPAVTENQPPTLTDEQAAAMALSGSEKALIQKSLEEMHSGLHDSANRLLPQPGAAGSARSLEEILTELQTVPENGFEAARERLAQERAGLSPPPQGDAPLSPGEQLLRLYAGMGDQFEQRLAAGLGKERARELRSASQAGWMNRFSEAGCRAGR